MEEGNQSYLVPMRLSNTNVVSDEFNDIWADFNKEMIRMQQEMAKFQDAMANRMFTSPHGFTTPLIQENEDEKQLKLRFDVSQYKPEDVEIRIEDNHLLVHARHEEHNGPRRILREYQQQFLLPVGVIPDSIRSNLSADGVLTVEAPIPEHPTGPKHLAIKH
ncbi:hypothetical protein WA026_013931 [Henosepilachna vigintioctopunctata]|uniref:SHSP domain-containing protein n=1 Tax=Henosepilachna vigintioctopunctata TaxID=420089 RepID=A0AAW1U9E4_9CUCU